MTDDWWIKVAQENVRALGGHVEEIQIMSDEEIDKHLTSALDTFEQVKYELFDTHGYARLFKELLGNRGLVVVEKKLLD